MVDEKIVEDTIQRMLDAEIDDSTIVSTLKDIGMSEEQARAKIEEVKGFGNEEDEGEEDSELGNNEHINKIKDEVKSQADKSELHETTTHNMLNEHGQKIDGVSKGIEDVKKSVGEATKTFTSSSGITKLSEIEEKLNDVSAQQKALTKLLEDILEVNRKILNDLDSK
jgi:hypothetical protein